MEQLDPPATACHPAGPPAQAELPSSCGTQVPFSQLNLSHASGEDVLERMAIYLSWKMSPKTFSLDSKFPEIGVKTPCFGLGTEVG